MTPSQEVIQKIKGNPTASYWLKNTIDQLENRDLVDAHHDILELENIYKLKLAEMQTELFQ